MSDPNKYGLPRYIPAKVRRKIRENSKFGCIFCRKGFYQYEHIDPTFEDATEHNSEAMCCLCGACHDSVTRGIISKEAVKKAYKKIRELDINQTRPPVGPLDFHDGNAELKIGNLLYKPMVRTILRYHGKDIITVIPGKNSQPGNISAIFTDDLGKPTLQLKNNEWIGSLTNWDIEVTGRKIAVRKSLRRIVLQIRLDPPGRVVIENLDMRFGSGHVIATDKTYAVGRYISDDEAIWLHASIKITSSSQFGAAIEFTDVDKLEARDRFFKNKGKELATKNRSIVMNSNGGVYVKNSGIAISSFCGSFRLGEFACGQRSLSGVREVIRKQPEKLPEYLGTGRF